MKTVKTTEPTADHIAAMAALKDALRPFGHLSPQELLAIAAQLVGNLIAFQDQTKMTSAMALELVTVNIELGNQTAVESIFDQARPT